ncbi:flagellar hook-associated protein [Candidatus Scalindua japonica]|uniref:Flagellar hook-associated protein 1 n=1 Tax=Candidatus Scalindua japonica TaxID=1284222 RepID=A0A286TVA1_9BACT|nr:flagellar hook-associated protein FlgK [Candidatus Scalindua japonica]GAX59813.1 flagellar hook-associated protein [Candidatus Scalindua japonica]
MASSDISIGLSGLLTAQSALQTIGHNIVNANTPGYSRQQVLVSARTPDVMSFGPIGSGVTVDNIQRIKDDLLSSQINSFTSLLGNAEVQNESLRNIEAIFNELSGTSLNGMLEKFFRSVQELSTTPELVSTRYQLLQDAQNLVTHSFRSLDEQFSNLKVNISERIESKVANLNSITSEISFLNRRINDIELGADNTSANDMLDKRDQLLTKLSKLGDIKVIKNKNDSSVDVLLGGTLVVNRNRTEKITTSLAGEGVRKVHGLSIAGLNSGELKGLMNMQNVTIPKYMQDIDTLAASFIKEVNNVHSEGVGLSGGFSTLASINAVDDSNSPLTNAELPYSPSVNTYSTGTVTSSDNGDGTTTVTGVGTTFKVNVKANDWIKLNDGNVYKITSVDSNSKLTVSGAYTDAVPAATNITDGSLYITVTDSSNAITKTNINIAADETLNTLSAKIGNIANINANVTNGILTITSDSGYTFNFTNELDVNPGTIGSAQSTLSGHYSGNDNDVFTLTVVDAGTGTVGSGSALIRATDANGKLIANLEVGTSYDAGSYLQITDGVSISFDNGSIAVGDKLAFDVTNDPDTSNVLSALGLNTFFEGNDASSIDVAQYIKDDVTRIAAASTSSPGDNTNALRLVNLRNQTLTKDATFSDFIHGSISQLGIETAERASETNSFKSLLTNLDSRRQEVSGVSIDEEMVNTIRFQQAFQASAKYLSTIKEVSDLLMQL